MPGNESKLPQPIRGSASAQPTTPGRTAVDGFVSYSRLDARRVSAVVDRIERQGRTLWIDGADIPAGALWREELCRAIEDASAIICFVSSNWAGSTECRAEVDLAISLGKRLVPVILEPVAVATLPGELRSVQWIEAPDAEADVDRVSAAVIAAIDVDPERVREHTFWLAQALRWHARDWQRSQLVRGRNLRAAEAWLQRAGRDPEPTSLQIAFVTASRRAERRRGRIQLSIAVAGVLIASTLAAIAVQQRNTAIRERNTARSRGLAVASADQLGNDPELALLLARAGWQSAHTSEALSALRAAVHRSPIRRTVHSGSASATDVMGTANTLVVGSADGQLSSWNASSGQLVDRQTLPGPVERLVRDQAADAGVAVTTNHDAAIFTVQKSGRLTVSAPVANVLTATISADGKVALFGLAVGTVLRSELGTSSVATVLRVSGDEAPAAVATSNAAAVTAIGTGLTDYRPGQLPVSGQTEGRLYVRDAHGTRLLHTYETPVSIVALDKPGTFVLSVATDGSGTVQRASTGQVMLEFRNAFQADLDPSGRYAAISTIEGQTMLGSLATRRWSTLAARSEPLIDLRFGENGVVVGATAAGSGYAWTTADGHQLGRFSGASGRMTSISVEPAARQVVTGHLNGDVDVWALPPEPVRVSLGASDVNGTVGIAVNSASVSPNGALVLTAATSGLIEVWTLDGRTACLGGAPPNEMAHCPLTVAVTAKTGFDLGLYAQAQFSPDGLQVAVLASDGSVWIFAASKVPALLAHAAADGTAAAPGGLSYSPDGTLILAQRGDRPPRIIDARTGRGVAVMRTPRSQFYSSGWLPNHQVVVADQNGSVNTYDARGHQLHHLAQIPGTVIALAATPDGRRIAVASGTRIDLLDAATGRQLIVFAGHTGDVDALAFSADSTYLLSGSLDGSARLWDTGTATTLSSLNAPGSQIASVAFDNVTNSVVAGGKDSTLYLDACDVCIPPAALARVAAQHSTRPLTDAQRAQFDVGNLLK